MNPYSPLRLLFQHIKHVTFAEQLVKENVYIEQTPLNSTNVSLLGDSPAASRRRSSDDDMDALFEEAEQELHGGQLPGKGPWNGEDVRRNELTSVVPISP